MSKAVKRRACPAEQREISAAECGENRVSRYACPESCPFNPFSPAQYDLFSETEAGVTRKGLDWFLDTSSDRAAALRQLDRLAAEERIEQHAWQVREFFFARDDRGRTCAERWADAGFPGLKNDERVIQRAVMQLRPRLIEVHRVLDDLRIEAVDLFEAEPKPFLICDRSLASRACRFTTLLGWYFPLPHFWRSFGFAVFMPALGAFAPQDAVAEIVRHLGGPADRAAWPEWFGSHFARFSEALDAVALARREQMFAGLDAEFGKAVYELRAPFAECREALDAVPAVAGDELNEGEENEGFAEARVWFDEAPEARLAGQDAQPVLGRVLLAQAHWRLEAMSGEKFGRLRKQFEAALGDRAKFTGEHRENLLAHLKAKEPNYNRALIPPRLLEQPRKMVLASNRVPAAALSGSRADIESQFRDQFERAWLEEPVPMFGGKTPRDAARDPAHRPALIRLLKERVRACDEQNLETGGSVDMNWLLQELGTHEIIFDPPPPRARIQPQPTPAFGNENGEEDDDDRDYAANLKHWPVLPARPFTKEEAIERLLKGLQEFETVEDAADAMEEAGGFLIEDVREVVGSLLTEDEHEFLEGYLNEVWFVFVPPDCYGPDLGPEELHEAFGNQLRLLENALRDQPEKSGLFLLENGPQPALVQALAGQLVAQRAEFAKSHQLQKESGALMLIILRAVIELLDAKCRGEADRP